MSEPKINHGLPQGYGTVTPWIISKDSAGLITFLEKAFGAEEKEGSRIYNQDGSIGHVEVLIGTSTVMLFDSFPNWPPTRAFLRLYVDDADRVYQQALDAGARSVTRVTELFWGDRVGRVADPFGNIWWIQSTPSGISYEDIQQRSQDPAMIKAMEYVQRSLIEELSNL